MKQEEKEKWLNALRKSLEDYSEPPKAGSWERLEKELAPISVAPKRSYFIYAVAAAVILLLVISSTAIYFLGDSSANYLKTAKLPVEIEKTMNEQPLKELTQPLIKKDKKTNILALGTPKNTKNSIPTVSVSSSDKKENTERKEQEETRQESIEKRKGSLVEEGKTEEKGTSQQQKRSRVSKQTEQINDFQNFPRKKSSKRWSVGLSAGNSTGFSNGNSDVESFGLSKMNDQYPLFVNSETLLSSTILPVKLNHKQPVTFGVSVRKQLSKRFALESGITYTLLESESANGYNNYTTYKQTLHYVGIPVKLNYLFLDRRFVTLYLSGGGMVEKSISGKIHTEENLSGKMINETTTNLNVKPLQWSLGGALGIQFNMNSQFGIFAEPGMTYFFNDGSEMETIRKETPFNFNLQLGVRISY